MHYIKLKDGHIIKTDSPQFWSEGEQLPKLKGAAEYRKQQIDKLREWLAPGATIYTVIKHVSKSGMSRRISALAVREGEICNISSIVSDVLEWRYNGEGSVVVGGCGMDMGFHLVYSLSSRLFPDGFAVTGEGRNGDTSGHDKDGGYALKQRWL